MSFQAMTQNVVAMSQGAHNGIPNDNSMEGDKSGESEYHDSVQVCQVSDGSLETLYFSMYHYHTQDVMQMMTIDQHPCHLMKTHNPCHLRGFILHL
jgi:hypothetical protein